MVPEQLSSGVVELRCNGERPIYLQAGWPVARYTLEQGFESFAISDVLCVSPDPVAASTPGARPRHQEPTDERGRGASSSVFQATRVEQDRVDALNEKGTDRAQSQPLDKASAGEDKPTYRPVEGGFVPVVPSPNSCLTPAEVLELRQLLWDFKDRFNDGSQPIQATTLLRAHLDTGDVAPISFPPRRLLPAMREVVRKAVAELDVQGITEPGTGCWSAPIVMVKKASGAWRLCCDYREVNKHVLIPKQSLPRAEDILSSFKCKRYFSVLDMCSGFYQIEIAEEDRPKTSFVTPDCQRQYRRLPFGFASSPAIFQRMVDMLLGGMKWVSAVGYIDEIIVYSDNWADHKKHLQQLFAALRSSNLQLHPAKCSFGAELVEYLGHVVSREGIRACPSKVRAILEMPPPTTVKATQRFLGKCQYYRKFVPNFSTTAAPLFKATASKQGFKWTAECQEAWERLREALSSEPLLAHPDYERDFIIDCDDSGDGLGAVLLQRYAEGKRVVAYASRALCEHEKKWTTTELEAAALIWALETFRPYVDGQHVLIRTDHAPLEYITSRKSQCRRLERWALRLQEFQFTIQHRLGSKQKHVDCLSRAPVPAPPDQRPLELDVFPERVVLRAQWEPPKVVESVSCQPPQHCISTLFQGLALRAHSQVSKLCRRSKTHACNTVASSNGAPEGDSEDDLQVILSDEEEECDQRPGSKDIVQVPSTTPNVEPLAGGSSIPVPNPIEYGNLKAAQAEDEDCRTLSALIRTPPEQWPDTWKKMRAQFLFQDEVLCIKLDDALPRVVLPAIFRQRAIHTHHLSYYAGHFGVSKTFARLACRYWWPAIRACVKRFFRTCLFCMAHRDAHTKQQWLNLPIGTPFEVVATDLFGPLPKTLRGNTHILVIIDHHTRWVELVPLPNPTAAMFAEALFNVWISRWGVPRALLSDNGPQFTAELLKQLCTVYGINKVYSAPYHPRGNSIAEAYMRSLKSTLRLCVQSFRKEWDVVLPAAALAYRSTPHAVTRYSPFFLVTGQEVVLPLSRSWEEPILCKTGASWLNALWRCRLDVLKAHGKVAAANEKAFAQSGRKLQPGMHVAARLTPKERQEKGKFSPLYGGPFIGRTPLWPHGRTMGSDHRH